MDPMAHPTSPPRAARGSYAKTPARRAEIVRAGLEVFSAGGYHAASVREIAEKVGLSQAGVLHHFSSKWELLSAVLTLRDEDALSWFPLGPNSRGTEVLTHTLKLISHNVEVPGLVELHCVLSAEATHPDHPAHQYFVQRYCSMTDLFTDAFGDMLTRGELRPGIDPRSAAIQCMALMDGLQVQWLLDRTALDMRVEMQRYFQNIATVVIRP
jgi:AcrR family transcriptional regulator